MNKIKQAGVTTVAILAAVSLAACGGGKSSSGNSGDGSDNAKSTEVKATDYLKVDHDGLKDGGELHLSLVELSEQGNPFHQDGTKYTSDLWYWYNPQMILFDDNAKAYPNPEFLESMKGEVKDGKTVVTYKINPKAKYNNGEEIDWKSFETTWKINNGKDKAYTPSSTDGYEHIESVTQGENAKEVVVTFDRAYPWWEGLFNNLANPKLADPEFYKTGYLKKFHPELGAGPYTVDSVDFNQGTAVFVPNDKWWGKKAKLDRVTFKQMEDQAAINAFKNGEIDAIGVASKNNQAKIADMKDLAFYVAMYPSNALLMQNAKSEVLSDPKVREAVFTAIDRQQIADIRFSGVNVPGKDGKLTVPFKEPQPGSFILFPTQEGYDNNFAAAVKYDEKKANELLEEAGWKKGDDGIREKDGKKLTVRYVLLGDAEISKGISRAYQAMLKKAGIDMQIQEKPSKEFSNVYTKRDFDLFNMGFSSSDPFGTAYFGQIYGSDSGLNLSSTGTKEFDAKIAELQKLPTQEEQIKRANELEKEAFKLYGIMPLFNGPSLVAMKQGLANMGAMGFTTMPKEMIGWKK